MEAKEKKDKKLLSMLRAKERRLLRKEVESLRANQVDRNIKQNREDEAILDQKQMDKIELVKSNEEASKENEVK